MAIADKLTKIETDLTSAYNKISQKGGTVPANKNTNNLTNAIDSIPEQPTFTSNGFANDSWDTIVAIADAGLAPEYYNIGDEKIISLSAVTDSTNWARDITAGQIKIKLVSFNTMNLTNGNKGHMTFVVWGTSGGNTIGDYEASIFRHSLPYATYSWAGAGDVKNWLNQTFKAALPKKLRDNLKTTRQKIYNNYSHQVVNEDKQISLPNLYNLGLDNFQSFKCVDDGSAGGSYRMIGNLGTEKPFMYFTQYINRADNTAYYNKNYITTADTTENWKFLRFAMTSVANNYNATPGMGDSSYTVWFYPTFTI